MPELVKVSTLGILETPADDDEFIVDDISEELDADRKKKLLYQNLSGSIETIPDHWIGTFLAFSWYTSGDAYISTPVYLEHPDYEPEYSGLMVQSSGLNSYCEINIPLQGGSYDVVLAILHGPDFGIPTIEIDGIGGYDEFTCYHSVQTPPVVYVAPATIVGNGLHQIRFRVTSKDARSTGYKFGGNFIGIQKKAD